MNFYKHLDAIAGEYGIIHNCISGLHMNHGFYTGGETLADKTREALDHDKQLDKSELEDNIKQIEQAPEDYQRWSKYMQDSVGIVARYVNGKAKDIDEGIAKAKESIGKRWARNKSEHLIEVTNSF